MKRAILVAVFALASAGLAMGQNWTSPVDVLGAHNNNGRGCAGCHSAAQRVVWFRSRRRSRYRQLCIVGTGCQPTVRQDDCVWRWRKIHGSSARHRSPVGSQEVGGILLCLSCHDGNVTAANMMVNSVVRAEDWFADEYCLTALATDPDPARQRWNHAPAITTTITRWDRLRRSAAAAYGLTCGTNNAFTVTAGYALRPVRSQLRLASTGTR